MAANVNDRLDQVSSSDTGRPVTATLSAPGHSIAGTSIGINAATNWSTTTGIHFSIYATTTVGSLTVKDTTTQTDWKGTLSGTTISGMVLTGGTDQAYSAGAIVEITPTAKWAKDLYDWGIAQHNQDGTHSVVTATSVVASGNITAANFIQTGGASTNGWNVGLTVPNTVVANGNRSYTCTINSTDLTSQVSAGMRLKFTRTVAAPTQCTSLNGTTQYYSKSSPSGMTFIDDFTVSAWVKISSYATTSCIASRSDGTSGWGMFITTAGQVQLVGYNGALGNQSQVISYQSVPLNKWVHLSANLDMSAFATNTDGGATGSCITFDGINVPSSVVRGGTNPTALVQAGTLNIGNFNGGAFYFTGKLAQVAIFNTKITNATMLTYISQGLAGTETSLISAYSFNGVKTDLNANANNLTANGSAVETNADSPFGGQADGTISSTLDYGIITKTAFSTNTTLTVQVPEGCTIPTSGGVSAVSYSTQKVPYGFPAGVNKFRLTSLHKDTQTTTSNVTYGSFASGGWALTVPIGEWQIGWQADVSNTTNTQMGFNISATALTGLSQVAGSNASPFAIRHLTQTTGAVKAFVQNPQSVTSLSTYVMYSFGATTGAGLDGSLAITEIFAECAYL